MEVDGVEGWVLEMRNVVSSGAVWRWWMVEGSREGDSCVAVR